MADQRESGITWCDETWNPIRGCARVSEGCRNCYAEKTAARFRQPGQAYEGLTNVHGRWNGQVRVIEEHLSDPLRWQRPRRVFVNSMGDLFHESLGDDAIDRVFSVMQAATRHTFIVLTKRAERMASYLRAERTRQLFQGVVKAPWPLPNVQIGVSVEDQASADERIPWLVSAPAAVRLLSMEPLLGPVDLSRWIERVDHCTSCDAEHDGQAEDRCPSCGEEVTLISTWGAEQAERYRNGERYDPDSAAGRADRDGEIGLHWVIVGGESGKGARPMHPAWVRALLRQCGDAGVPFHFKQWGEFREATREDRNASPPRPGVMLDLQGRQIKVTSSFDPVAGDVVMVRAGKRHTGRMLDGRVWDEFPT